MGIGENNSKASESDSIVEATGRGSVRFRNLENRFHNSHSGDINQHPCRSLDPFRLCSERRRFCGEKNRGGSRKYPKSTTGIIGLKVAQGGLAIQASVEGSSPLRWARGHLSTNPVSVRCSLVKGLMSTIVSRCAIGAVRPARRRLSPSKPPCRLRGGRMCAGRRS